MSPEKPRQISNKGKIVRGLSILALGVAGCAPRFSSNQEESPSPTEPNITEVISNPTQESYPGQISLSIAGITEDFDKKTQTETIINTPELKKALNKQGYAPILNYEKNSLGVIFSVSGNRSCLVYSPERLLNFGNAGRLSSESGIVNYGNWNYESNKVKAKIISFVSLSGMPENVVCANAFVVGGENVDEQGKLKLLFIDRDTGKVKEEIQAAFPANFDIRVEWRDTKPMILVNGQEIKPTLLHSTP